MTENEKLRRAIEEEKELYEITKDRYEKLGVKNCKDRAEEHNMMVKWLEEIQQYRAIGTIDEFKALKEKNEPKKPTIERVNYSHNQYADNYKCPVCGQRMISKDETGWYSGRRSKYCDNCGQKLDWQ